MDGGLYVAWSYNLYHTQKKYECTRKPTGNFWFSLKGNGGVKRQLLRVFFSPKSVILNDERYLLTHRCVSTKTLGSFRTQVGLKDPKVSAGTQWWVKRQLLRVIFSSKSVILNDERYLLTHRCVSTKTLGSFRTQVGPEDPKVSSETQWWVKIQLLRVFFSLKSLFLNYITSSLILI